MTELSRHEPQYDAFLFASVCETDEMTLSVLSVLARQDVDPWQEAARLADLSRDQAVNSLASNIWKSNSERWSPSEANKVAVGLIELLPSHSCPRSSPLWTDGGNDRVALWVVAAVLFMSIAMGNRVQKLTGDSGASSHGPHSAGMTVPKDAVPQQSRQIGTDQGIGDD